MRATPPNEHPALAGLLSQQHEAVAGIVSEFKYADRCKCIMACGTGKTRVGPATAILIDARTVVVYLPSLALIRQTVPDWLAARFSRQITYLCVCSDQSVVDTAASDEPTISVEELAAELGQTAVTTDANVVRQFLTLPFKGTRVLFSTYQSSDVVRDGCPDGFRFCLGIFDEAHRTATGQAGNVFSAPLNDAHTPIAKRLFMTATPKHWNYKRRDAQGEAVVEYSMDNPAVFGRVAYALSLRQAIDRGIIVDYKIVVAIVDDTQVASAIRGTTDALTTLHTPEVVAHAVAIRDAMTKFNARKVLSFHNSVRDAKHFAESPVVARELAGQTELFHVNGQMRTADRSSALARFATRPLAIVTNARCLTEGVDVPEIDMVAFLHPKKSRIDIVQAVGRALRKGRDGEKQTGYILLPLYAKSLDATDIERALHESDYYGLWQIVQAMREQDPALDREIAAGTWRKARSQAPAPLEFLHVVGAPDALLHRIRLAVSSVCVDSLQDEWEVGFAHYEAYIHASGDPRVPHRYCTPSGFPLGHWVSWCRRDLQNAKLSAERVARLDVLGFVQDPRGGQFDAGVAEFKVHMHAGGDPRVPSQYSTPSGYRLGGWVGRLRQDRKNGRLSAERIACLDALGFIWSVREGRRSFEAAFAEYASHVRTGGDPCVPQGYRTPSGLHLGQWVSELRKDNNAGRLSADRLTRLNAVGFIWDALADQFERGFAELAAYVHAGGDPRVPADYQTQSGYRLGQWVRTRRQDSKADRLSVERIARLDGLGFVWDPLGDQFEVGFAEFAAHVRTGGDPRVPTDYRTPSGYHLGKWVSGRRKDNNAGSLSTDRIARLNAVGFIWDALADRFEVGFVEFAAYVRAGGDPRVPADYRTPSGYRLGKWVSVRRKDRKKDLLSADRIARFDALGFVWDPLGDQFEVGFAEFEAHVHAGGDPRVQRNDRRSSGHRLGLWVSARRQDRKKGRLSADRIARLDALGFVW